MNDAQEEPPVKRPRGRPRADGAGPVRPVNVMLDSECLAILQRMSGGSSQAVRQALRFWALHHPPDGADREAAS